MSLGIIKFRLKLAVYNVVALRHSTVLADSQLHCGHGCRCEEDSELSLAKSFVPNTDLCAVKASLKTFTAINLRYEAPSQVFFEKLRIRSAAILRNIPFGPLKNPKGFD